MTGTDLLEALSFVDEKYIQEAENARLSAKIPWIKVLSVAACLCILITGALALERMNDKSAEAEAAPEAAPIAPESAMKDESLTGELVDISYAKLRVVKVLEDGNFEAIVEADEPMEMDTTVIVRSGEGTVFEYVDAVEGAAFDVYDATYSVEQKILYVSRVILPKE